MDRLAYLLVVVVLIVSVAAWVRSDRQGRRRRIFEYVFLASGFLALAAPLLGEIAISSGYFCQFSTACKSVDGKVAANRSQAASNPAFVLEESKAVAGQESFGPLSEIDRMTAVYDITAHTVYLPNGMQLEAHSGLGPRLDDPRYVHEHMRGATPPSTYDLIPRERPFHGVKALRLMPVGMGNIFGRKGLLAHTYMLGPKGHSNGCVVFKDYHAFLAAYEAGQIKRLLVVSRLD